MNKNQKRINSLLTTSFFLFTFSFQSIGQIEGISSTIEKQSFTYSIKENNHLGLDIYTQKGSDSNIKRPCIIFVFGGAFITGHRDDSVYNRFFNTLVEHDYPVVSISYRLGMRGIKHVSKFNTKPLSNAINMAVEDLYDATNWLISHAGSFGIDTSMIILSGSSSGAITILQSEYDRINDNVLSNKLPRAFDYAGTISFSGAILSFDWGLRYRKQPAPALLFHGTGDKIVPYKKIAFLNKGFYGSGWIAKIYKNNNYSFDLYSEEDLGHEVAVSPMYDHLPMILDFIQQFVIEKKPLQINYNIKDPTIKPMMTQSSEELLKKLDEK
jgi:predicted esterase